MKRMYSWLYVDYTNNIWMFSQNDNKELYYRIMYEEGKWTQDKLIDKDVQEFTIYVDDDETIHIVYSSINGELKYCTLKDEQWIGRSLYQVEDGKLDIQNLKVRIIGSDMHILYLLVAQDGSDHGVIMHCIWNGSEIKVSSLQDIILVPNSSDHYLVISNRSDMDMIFLSDEGDEISVNYCRYQGNSWTSVKRLYGIQGSNLCIEMLKDNDVIHILNKSTEDSNSFLDHIYLEKNGTMQEYRIYECQNELMEPILIEINNKLYSCWLEENKIYYSSFEGDIWSVPIYFDRKDEKTVHKYYCSIASEEEKGFQDKEVYGTNDLDFIMFDPSSFIVNSKGISNESNQNINTPDEADEIQNLKQELSRIKNKNRDLERIISSLNMQLQKRKKFVQEYEEQVVKTLEEKQKSDENCSAIMELQQNIQKELEDINKQLIKEQKLKIDAENKLKQSQEELERVSREKKMLNEELELEKNQSFIERLLRGRSTGV